ncbi:MAG: DUF4271 domain-containing protein [Bacteroidales bacterium]|nr:DUF4271 domain-containing protein [Bacteroidales bacterium]
MMTMLQSIPWTQSTPMSALVLLSVLIFMFFLRDFVSLVPSLLGCAVRTKENQILEDSMMLRRSRNAVFAVSLMPYALLMARYRLWCPSFLEQAGDFAMFMTSFAVLVFYFGLRFFLGRLLRPSNVSRSWSAGDGTGYSLFILLMIVSVLMVACMLTLGRSDANVQSAMLTNLMVAGALLLIRRFHILLNLTTLFPAFLYLCALEILPAAILVVCAVLL